MDNKAIRLYYKDKELTKCNGLHSSFYASQRWFTMGAARWDIKEISRERLVLVLDYAPVALSQIFTLTCKGETIEIAVELQLSSPIILTNYDVKFEFDNEYKNWATLYESGDFFVDQYIKNICPIRLKENKASKVILKPLNGKNKPTLLFESGFKNGSLFGICKRRDGKEECLCFNFSAIIPRKENFIKAGRHRYFEGSIVLNKDLKPEESVLHKSAEFSKGHLKFIFDEGRGKIFWRTKELTAGLGLYTSARALGIWHDSYQAIWDIEQKDRNKIVAKGDWPYIPISQLWQIELAGDNEILFTVDMDVYEEVTLEIEQASLMLSSEYKNWAVPGAGKGEFLDEYPQDYDILPFRFWYGKPPQNQIGAVKELSLPALIFKNKLDDIAIRGIAENADYIYRARLLQYQKCSMVKFLPGKYRYFCGAIELDTAI
jgi:hypothetical protein